MFGLFPGILKKLSDGHGGLEELHLGNGTLSGPSSAGHRRKLPLRETVRQRFVRMRVGVSDKVGPGWEKLLEKNRATRLFVSEANASTSKGPQASAMEAKAASEML